MKLYGGLHQKNVIEDKAAVLASRGYACFVMAYFGIEGLPKTYVE